MSTPTIRIKELLPCLPDKDIKLGEKFLSIRDFDSLKELIDSALFKVRKSQKSDTPKPEYINLNVDDISRLKSEVDAYIAIIEDKNPEEYIDGTGESVLW